MQVVLSGHAQRQLELILEFYELQGAMTYVTALSSYFYHVVETSISVFPHIFPHDAPSNMNKAALPKYDLVVYYRAAEDLVTILGVYESTRDHSAYRKSL